MPIYEYRRPNGTTFEVLQSMSDEPLTEDPNTGVPVHRVMHAPAIHFKGKGFYNTDYGTKRRNREMADSGADKNDAKPADSKSDAAKAESKPGATSSSDGAKPATAKADKKADKKPAEKA